MSAYPPIHTQAGINVTPETALLYLSSYLTSAKTSPHLLPNARLEASGPTAGSSNASVTIHNLERVQAGLRGEWLAPKLDLEEQDIEKKKTKLKGGEEEGWEDLETYQREQSIEGPAFGQEELGVEDEGDVEEGENAQVDFYGSGGEEKEDVDVEMGEAPEVEKTKAKSAEVKKVKKVEKAKEALDPAARKKAKKERLKAEKRAKEMARMEAQKAA